MYKMKHTEQTALRLSNECIDIVDAKNHDIDWRCVICNTNATILCSIMTTKNDQANYRHLLTYYESVQLLTRNAIVFDST